MGRDLNSHADALKGLTLIFKGEICWTISVDSFAAPSPEVPQESILVNTELGLRWMEPIVNFLRHDKLLEEKREVHKIRIKETRFWIFSIGDLYKRSYQGPYLLCMHLSLGERVLFEINTGMCRLHSQERSLTH